VATSSQSRTEPKFPNVAMYLNLGPTLITNIRKKLVQKYVRIDVNNKLNLNAIGKNSKAQSKVHQDTYNKHQNAIIECNTKVLTINTRSKMQHQLFVVEHKIHVHQIFKTTKLKCKNSQCYKGMIINFIHNDKHTLR